MKVENGRSVRSIPARNAPAAKAADGFSEILNADNISAATPALGATPISGVAGLFALQEIADAPDDRRAAATGDEILARLDDLRRGLLLGQVSQDRLDGMARLANQLAAQAADPQLRAILEEIEIRALVELAKLEMSR